MIKKIAITLGVIGAVAIAIGIYNINKPTTNATIDSSSVISETIIYDELNEYIESHNGDYVLILADDSDSSTYLINNILIPLSLSEHTSLPRFVKVDMSDAKVSVTRLEKITGSKSYPCLIYVHDSEINNYLDFENEYNEETVKAWLFNNNLWNGPYIEIVDNGTTMETIEVEDE